MKVEMIGVAMGGGLWLSWKYFILKWCSVYMGICSVILYTFCILKWCVVLLKLNI